MVTFHDRLRERIQQSQYQQTDYAESIVAENFREAVELAKEDANDWLLHRIQRTAPVRTGRYRAGWKRRPFGLDNDVWYAGEVAKRAHFTEAIRAYHIYLAERIKFRINQMGGITIPNRRRIRFSNLTHMPVYWNLPQTFATQPQDNPFAPYRIYGGQWR